MNGRIRNGMHVVIVWSTMLALSVLPFVHAHAGVAWSAHAGDHAHPPVIHSVFTPDEAAHPPEEPELRSSGAVLALAAHELGHEIELASSATATSTVFGVFAPAVLLPDVTSIRQPAQAEGAPSAGILDVASAPRAPPISPLS
ncbi:MAG: hypothetical protein ABIO65_02100 [Nitrospiria bacterium]